MFIAGNLLIALARVLGMLISVMYLLILVRALISWVNPDPYNPIVQFLYRVTEPLLEPIRRFMPPMGLDLSPIVAFLILMFLDSFVVQTLVDLGMRLKY